MTNSISIGLVQQSCTADVDKNLESSIDGIQSLAEKGTDVIVLPELHRTLYFCQTEDTANFDLSETIPGPTTDKLAAAAKAYSLIIIASIFERRAKGIYHNTAVVIERDGSIAGMYRKMHPDMPEFLRDSIRHYTQQLEKSGTS